MRRIKKEAPQCAAVILAHDGVAAALPAMAWSYIVQVSDSGIGVLNMDGALWEADPEIWRFFGASSMKEQPLQELYIPDNLHDITCMQLSPVTHELPQNVSASYIEGLEPGFESLAYSDNGSPAIIAYAPADSRSTKGRRAALLFSPRIWLPEVFGHAMGLDDLLWRSMVWVARKPFIMLSMPPFAVCRIDDASGHDRFNYIRVLNDYGWLPHIGLFLNDIDEDKAEAARGYYNEGKAEFGAHAFSELECSVPDQIYLHHDGQEYGTDELAGHFARLDEWFEWAGINPSRTVNSHFSEIGINSLPFLLARGQCYSMSFVPHGIPFAKSERSWAPYPYGHQGFHYAPLDTEGEFWNVMGHHLGGYKVADQLLGPGEFLLGCTTFAEESTHNDIEMAVLKAVNAVKMGIASGFFGTLMTHEQRISVLKPEEWTAIVERISMQLEGWDVLYRSYDEVARYCKDKALTRIISSNVYKEEDGLIQVRLAGQAEQALYVHVYTDTGNRTLMHPFEVEPFSGFASLTIRK
ncbi:hypothetical protein Back11_50340 [Paenibacillus baekrokdamisoli]|uniref:Uncharacterized protein n=1 Tax=Paenibacillus baekrokdamisoli TaxID=1712516 RepID=A0A3G9JKY3_9BACL|nr:hypothetical protein Back11_50340 [Paenibacillus baekrokdamisoli]